MSFYNSSNGVCRYGYKDGYGKFILHRDDGPAVEYPSGDVEYWFNGELHRLDGPAVIKSDHIIWFKNGLRHRMDGPALELNDVRYGIGFYKEWWVEGEKISVLDNDEFLRLVKLIIFW